MKHNGKSFPKISLGISEAARATGVSRFTIHRQIKDGLLRTALIRGRRVVLATSLQKMLEQGEREAISV